MIEPVNCGCGGEAQVLEPSYTNCYVVQCGRCGIRTPYMNTETEAIEAWNKAMENNQQNVTIMRKKIDLLSILQAIKTDKIRVWMNYDGKIVFQNTKTGNEISVNPYYDMNGEKYDE